MGLAERAGLAKLADQHLSVPTDKGANAGLKVASLVAGMVAGADSIDDMALLRHGGMGQAVRRGSTRRRRWGRSCGRSPSATSASSTRSPSRFLLALAGLTRLARHGEHHAARLMEQGGYRVRRCRRHRDRGPRPRQAGRRVRLQPGPRPERAAGHRDHAGVGAGDRGAAAPQGRVRLAPRREAAGRRRGQDRPPAPRAGDAGAGADGLGVLRPQPGPRRPGRWRGRCRSPSGWTTGSRPRSPRSPTMRGPRSSTPTRSSTRPPGSGSPGPRSPRSTFTAFAAQPKADQVPGRLIVRRIPDFHADKHRAAGQDGAVRRVAVPRVLHHHRPDRARHRDRGPDPPSVTRSSSRSTPT